MTYRKYKKIHKTKSEHLNHSLVSIKLYRNIIKEILNIPDLLQPPEENAPYPNAPCSMPM
jgi:hypothetical protein